MPPFPCVPNMIETLECVPRISFEPHRMSRIRILSDRAIRWLNLVKPAPPTNCPILEDSAARQSR